MKHVKMFICCLVICFVENVVISKNAELPACDLLQSHISDCSADIRSKWPIIQDTVISNVQIICNVDADSDCITINPSVKVNMEFSNIDGATAGRCIHMMGPSDLVIDRLYSDGCGQLTANDNSSGGFLYSAHANNRATIYNSQFYNSCGYFGGSIYFAGASLTIDHSYFYESSAIGYGGVMRLFRVNHVDIRSSTLKFNKAAQYGGGIAAHQSNICIRNTTINENSSSGSGGGIYSGSSSLTVYDSNIEMNTSQNKGDSIYCVGDSENGGSSITMDVGTYDGMDEMTLYRCRMWLQ